MGMMDNITGKMGNTDEMQARFEELKMKEQTGDIDDQGRQELSELRTHFDKQ